MNSARGLAMASMRLAELIGTLSLAVDAGTGAFAP